MGERGALALYPEAEESGVRRGTIDAQPELNPKISGGSMQQHELASVSVEDDPDHEGPHGGGRVRVVRASVSWWLVRARGGGNPEFHGGLLRQPRGVRGIC